MTDQVDQIILKIKSMPKERRFNFIDEKLDPSDEREEIKIFFTDDGEPNTSALRQEIEPWLTALFQSEHLSLLIGTGITSAIHKIATNNLPQGMSTIEFTEFKEQVEQSSKTSAIATDRGKPNVEDQIRVSNDLIRGLEIYLSKQDSENEVLQAKLDTFKSELTNGLDAFTKSVQKGEHNIATAEPDKLKEGMEYLTSFLVSFCSRSATRERLNLFTTNYDRLIEWGAELAGIRLIDRFSGIINPVFRASRLQVDMHYNPPGIRGEPRYLEGVAQFTKLHGSLDWVSHDKVIKRFPLPFGANNEIKSYFPVDRNNDTNVRNLMIYPNSDKERETADYPYVELFRDLAAAICQPNATLVLYGYGFGDEHINRIIKDMLTIPSTHLVIISYTDEGERAMKFYNSVSQKAQITLLIGSLFGDIKNLVDNFLPKAAIDRTTFRMADLLKSRGITTNDNQDHSRNGGK